MPILPVFRLANFRPGEPIDNPWFSLVPGRVTSFVGVDAEGEATEANDFFATSLTKTVLGVRTLVVRDTAYEDGLLVEETIDFFTQDRFGNVWYFGEEVINYRYDDDGNFLGTDHDGAWLAGVDGAKPGWIMPADPRPGLSYYNEFAPGVALDQALVIGPRLPPGAEFSSRLVKTLDTSVLDPDAREFKYYIAGIGLVRVEEGLDENNVPELLVRLQGVVRAGSSRPPDGAEALERGDFVSDGKARWVTIIANDSELDNALGYYIFNPATGRIGEGRILIADASDDEAGHAIRIRIPDGQGIGFFFVPDGANIGVDLADYRAGGLFFTNMLTHGRARLTDGMAPIVTDADGNPLPIPVFHALGAVRGANLLNPGLGLQAVEWEVGDEDEEGVLVIGFEDQRRTQEEHDGDHDDLVIAFSDARLDESEVDALVEAFAGEDELAFSAAATTMMRHAGGRPDWPDAPHL